MPATVLRDAQHRAAQLRHGTRLDEEELDDAA
jgi:hypothetical protein